MDTTTTVYSSRATNWPVLAVAAGLAVPLFVQGLTSPEPGASLAASLAVLAVIIVGIVLSTSLRVTAGTSGVIVRFGPLGLPRWTIPINRIDYVDVTYLPPWAMFGGVWWSRRDGLRLTQRTGPALRLRLTTGRRVTITVNEPDAALAVLRDAVAGQRRRNQP